MYMFLINLLTGIYNRSIYLRPKELENYYTETRNIDHKGREVWSWCVRTLNSVGSNLAHGLDVCNSFFVLSRSLLAVGRFLENLRSPCQKSFRALNFYELILYQKRPENFIGEI